MSLKVGDVVELRSGGPKMTVAAVKADRAFCVWFNRKDDYHEEKTGEFLVATLKAYQSRGTVPSSVQEREEHTAHAEPS